LFANAALQAGGKTGRHRGTVVQDLIDLDQKIDIASPLMVIDAGAKQAHAGIDAEKFIGSGMDGLDLCFSQAHGVKCIVLFGFLIQML
jgi:hypothetical protein